MGRVSQVNTTVSAAYSKQSRCFAGGLRRSSLLHVGLNTPSSNSRFTVLMDGITGGEKTKVERETEKERESVEE